MNDVHLGDIAQINPRPATRPGSDDVVSFLGMADIDQDRGTTTTGHPRRYEEVSQGYTPFEDGDLLVAKITPCFENGKIAQARLDYPLGMGSTEFHIVRPDPSLLNARYALHLLRSPEVRLAGERRMTGSAGQKRVPANFLQGLSVRLPTMDRQRRIADVLDRAAGLRAKRHRSVSSLDTLRWSLFRSSFGDLLSNDRSWTTAPLSELIAGFESGKNVVAKDSGDSSSRYRVLKISAVTSLRFRPEESKPAPADHQPASHHFIRAGDLLFSRANTTDLIGATALVQTNHDNLLLPDKLWRLVWREPDEATPYFVRQLFQQPAFRREIGRRASGSSGSMQNISQAKVLNISVGLPPLALRQVFDEKVSQLEHSRTRLARHAAGLDVLVAGLHHRAFRGEM
ncbi:hypothetical protein QOZ88_19870 [Blastococcus sp. BMG 814]|uniref:Type I restriction enzyme, S subunit n=1 Tax=Blastococcus carthaginiensis TaxID=3050034 RepID=A0ABT9IH53_9ACTN|nr:hypothetical protein [Blastococcus carthaginiensis]MDP5184897.1 hypothetical protein [Blastococcus carthaginiensis]